MTAKTSSNAALVALGVVIVAEATYAIIVQEWWLLAVAAGLAAVFLSQVGESRGRQRH